MVVDKNRWDFTERMQSCMKILREEPQKEQHLRSEEKKKRNEQRKKSEKEDKRDWSSVGDDFYDVKTGKTVQDCQILQKGPIR